MVRPGSRPSSDTVAPIAVNEWPAPMGFTRRPLSAAAATMRATSAIEAGWTAVTSVLTVPAQFVQMLMVGPSSHGGQLVVRGGAHQERPAVRASPAGPQVADCGVASRR